MIRNYYLLVGIVMAVTAALGFILYIIPRQLKEVQRPPNQFSKTRMRILMLEILILCAIVSGIPRAIQVLNIPAVNTASKIASVGNRLPFIGILVLLILIYNTRIKID